MKNCMAVFSFTQKSNLHDLDCGIGRLKPDFIMAAIAEGAVGGRTAAAEGKCHFARRVVLVAIGIHHFDNAVGILYAQRTILAHRNRDLRHETSKWNE